jgi:hypothetical protein
MLFLDARHCNRTGWTGINSFFDHFNLLISCLKRVFPSLYVPAGIDHSTYGSEPYLKQLRFHSNAVGGQDARGGFNRYCYLRHD